MLQAPLMKPGIIAVALTCAVRMDAQVRSTNSLRLTGETGERRIDGLAEPMVGNAAVTVSGSLASGGFAWSSATQLVDTIVLTSQPPLEAYADGTLLRFTAPALINGQVFLKVQGLPAFPLVRTDGLPLVRGQVPQGYITEVIHVGGRFFVMNTTGSGCPPGFLQAHESLCFEANATTGLLFKQGVERCAALGGKLCNWDEYLAACTILEGQLSNLFVDWEWMDDSSNHGHGADQVGRYTCLSQRHYGQIPVNPANTRCCYRPR